MEYVQMFRQCIKRETTVKKEFQWIGLSRKALKEEPLKDLDEDTTFASLMNWIMNRMPKDESIKIRFRTENQVYQVTLHYHERKLSAKELKMTNENDSGCVLYDWEKEINYDNLTTEKIRQSMQKANKRNQQRPQTFVNTNEIMENFFNRRPEIINEDMGLIEEVLGV